MRVLIVEDDAGLREALGSALRQAAHQTDEYVDGNLALSALLATEYDLAVVDLTLPGLDGIALVQAVRRHRRGLPILIITARDAVNDRIAGLDAGADDYLVKPFELPEFEAHVRALLRRHRMDRGETIRLGKLTLTPGQPLIELAGQTVELSSSEFNLLELLVRRPGKVVGRDLIGDRLSKGDEPPSDTAIEICVHRLRRKVAPHLRIRALRGFGYLLETDELIAEQA